MEATLAREVGVEGRREEMAAIGIPARSVMELFEELTTEITEYSRRFYSLMEELCSRSRRRVKVGVPRRSTSC